MRENYASERRSSSEFEDCFSRSASCFREPDSPAASRENKRRVAKITPQKWASPGRWCATLPLSLKGPSVLEAAGRIGDRDGGFATGQAHRSKAVTLARGSAGSASSDEESGLKSPERAEGFGRKLPRGFFAWMRGVFVLGADGLAPRSVA